MPIPGTCMSVQPQGLCLANPELIRINSPLAAHWPRWQWASAGHPDNAFVCYVLGDLAEAFQVGFDHSRALNSAAQNMHSARLNAAVIDNYYSRSGGRENVRPIPTGAGPCPTRQRHGGGPHSWQMEANHGFILPRRWECEQRNSA